ncbi:MAG: DUF2085 domain-containing protein [Thermoplasmata archaeon]|nr:DUF2085 domain-containing protein [Thermoplasmata archaeon]
MGPPGPPLPTGRSFLLSHHLPGHYDRTISVPGTRGSVHLCTRCTGQALGGLGYLVVLLTGALAIGVLLEPRVQVLWAVAPLPAAADWLRQSVRGGESTNARRLLTGGLLGAALFDVLLLAATRQWSDLLIAAAVFLAYGLAVAAVLFASGAWRRVLEEHLPGIALPPS